MGKASKWFLCFRPPPTIEIDPGVDCSADRVFTLIAAARKTQDLKKKKKQKKSPKTKTPTYSISDHHAPPTNSSRRSFSGVIKAVLFETSLSRRVREAKLRNSRDRSVAIPPSDQEHDAAGEQTPSSEQLAIALDRKTDSKRKEESSDSAPSSDCCSTSVTEETTQTEKGSGKVGVRINPVVCLMLISLWGTVFWGRLCAVMTTTVWIYALQSGAMAVGLGLGLGEKLTMNRKKKQASERSEREIDSFCGEGDKLIERGAN